MLGVLNQQLKISTVPDVNEAYQALAYKEFWYTGNTILDQRPGTGTARPQQPRRAYQGDGTAACVRSSQNVSVDSAVGFSISFRVNVSGGVTDCVIDIGTLRPRISIKTSNQISVYDPVNGEHTVGGANAITYNNWHHVVVVYGNGFRRVYLNGVQVGADDTITNISETGLFDFMRDSGSDGFLNGKGSDVRLYSKALIAAEVTHVLTFGESGTDPGTDNLELHYKCDDTHPTIAYDSSGNENHGTKTNITPSSFHYEGGDVPYSWQNEVGYSPRRNLLGYLNDFSDSYWTKGAATVTGGQSDPFGGTAATQVSGNGASIICYVRRQDIEVPVAGNYVFSVYAKRGTETTFIRLAATEFDEVSDCYFDLENGTVGSGSVAGAISDAGNGWYRCSITAPVASTDLVGRFQISLAEDDDDAQWSSNGEQADQDIFIFQPQLESGSLTDFQTHTLTDDATGDDFFPRDESNPTKDIFGNDLQYIGEVPKNGGFEQSNCATFNGVNQYVQGDGKATTGTITKLFVSLKLKHAIADGAAGIAHEYITNTGDNRSWRFTILSDGELRFGTSGDGVSLDNCDSGVYVPDDEWAEIACYYDEGDISFIVNGEVLATDTTPYTSLFDATLDFAVGCESNNSNVFSGSACNFRLFEGSAAETAYNNRAEYTYRTGATVCWPMAEGAGNKHYDVSGNDNHGTITNADSSYFAVRQNAFHANIKKGFSGAALFNGTSSYFRTNEASFDWSAAFDIQFDLNINSSHTGNIITGAANQYIAVSGSNIRIVVGGSQFLFAHAGFNRFDSYRVSYSGGTTGEINFYINGSLVGTETNDAVSAPSTTLIRFGVNAFTSGLWLDGFLRNVSMESGGTDYYTGSLVANTAPQSGLATVAAEADIVFPKTPAQSATLDALGNALTNPAVVGHNGAETEWNRVLEPDAGWFEGLGIDTNYEFGDTLTPPNYKTVVDAANHENKFYTER